MLNTSIEQLATARASALTAVDRMNKANSTHGDFKLLIQANLDDVSQTNIVQATSKMSELQTIVQAGYLAFSRLSSLQLSDYLR
jgi:flagellin-like hook-associated protein FlgL